MKKLLERVSKSETIQFAIKAFTLAFATILLFLSVIAGGNNVLFHRHLWIEGKCEECGKVCSHPEFENGFCTVCGGKEPQVNTETAIGANEKDPEKCPHFFWTSEGKCTVCGFRCPHEQHGADGLCVICGGDCDHSVHDREGRCINDGEYTGHDFKRGICPVCGMSYTPIDDYIPMMLWNKNFEAQGTVTTLNYSAKDYTSDAGEQEMVLRTADVYLPYGYSESGKYDVLFLIDGCRETWLTSPQSYYYNETDLVYTVYIKDLLDNMICQGLCEPVIVVAPRFECRREELPVLTDHEFVQDLLPQVVAEYSTYAPDNSRESIAKARNHFGCVGFDYGADYMFRCIMENALDMVSWYGSIALRATDMKSVGDSLLNNEELRDQQINYLYMSAGEWDELIKNNTKQHIDALQYLNQTDKMTSPFVKIKGAFHDGRSCNTGLYNCLRVFFR